jgi:hypothetical protein
MRRNSQTESTGRIAGESRAFSLLFAIACIVAAPLHAAEMQTFISTEGGYEVRLPAGKIRSDTTSNENGPETHINGIDAPGIAYIVSYWDLPLQVRQSTEAQYRLLEASRDTSLERDEANLRGERRIRLAEGYPGIHWRAVHTDKTSGQEVLTRASFYLVSDRMYGLIVQGFAKKSDCREADEFLHSMVLLDRAAFSNDPKRYVSPDGKFQIHFPFAPQLEPQTSGSRYVATTVQGRYVVQVTDVAGLADKDYDGRRQALDVAVKDLLAAHDGKVVERVDVKHSNRYDGYALRLDVRAGKDDFARGLYRGRLLVVAGRLYEFSVQGSTDDADSEFANYFLNSFAVKP